MRVRVRGGHYEEVGLLGVEGDREMQGRYRGDTGEI